MGEEKALAATADLSRIERLCLDGRNIDRLADAAPSSSGGPSAAAEILGAMLPRATELDLSRNLISSWGVVADMVAALPSLGATLSLFFILCCLVAGRSVRGCVFPRSWITSTFSFEPNRGSDSVSQPPSTA